MDIKVDEQIVGSLYINIQIPLTSFKGKTYSEVLDMVKGANGQTQQVFVFDVGSFMVSSFRRIYNDGEKLCIEGAQLAAV